MISFPNYVCVICEAINIYCSENTKWFFLCLLSHFPLQSLNIHISYIPASIIYVILNAASAKNCSQKTRGPSRVEAKRSAASRRAFTFLGLDLHKQASIRRLSVHDETTTWIVNISPRAKRGMSVCFSFPPPRERKREGRTKRDARARARLLSIRNGALPPSRNSPAAKRCSPLRQRDRVFA